MAVQGTVRVVGLKTVLKRLGKLPERIQKKVMRAAVRKAATPVVRAARQRIPKGSGLKPDGTPRKNLKQTITKTSVKRYGNTFAITIGPEKWKGLHAHLVHDGTQPHGIPLNESLVLGGTFLPAGFVIDHPGSQANPFLEQAVNATRKQVQDKLRQEILAGIEKQVKALA